MGYFAEGSYILLVVALAVLANKKFGLSQAAARKLVHIMIGFVFPIQYFFFREDALSLILFPTVITVSLFLIARFTLVPSMVNPKNPYGIFYYALGILVLNLISVFYPAFFAAEGAAIACLSLGDGMAAIPSLIFKKTHPLFREKTVEGTLACLLTPIGGMLLLGLAFPALALPLPIILAATVTATLLELFGGRFDNLAILFGTAGLVALLLEVA